MVSPITISNTSPAGHLLTLAIHSWIERRATFFRLQQMVNVRVGRTSRRATRPDARGRQRRSIRSKSLLHPGCPGSIPEITSQAGSTPARDIDSPSAGTALRYPLPPARRGLLFRCQRFIRALRRSCSGLHQGTGTHSTEQYADYTTRPGAWHHRSVERDSPPQGASGRRPGWESSLPNARCVLRPATAGCADSSAALGMVSREIRERCLFFDAMNQ